MGSMLSVYTNTVPYFKSCPPILCRFAELQENLLEKHFQRVAFGMECNFT